MIKNINSLKDSKNNKIENGLERLADINRTLVKANSEKVNKGNNPKVEFSKNEIKFFKETIKKKKFEKCKFLLELSPEEFKGFELSMPSLKF